MSGSEARPLRRDQQRALKAYAWAANAHAQKQIGDYQIAVRGFAATLLRGGLAAAVSTLERNVDLAARQSAQLQLLSDLAGYHGYDAETWPSQVRQMLLGEYMRTTRETIALLSWLTRACRAVAPA